MMRSRILGVLLALAFVGLCYLLAESGGAPTTAIGNANLCVQSGCHESFALNARPELNLLTVTGFPTTYAPGAAYDMTVTVKNNPNVSPSSALAGFAAYVNSTGGPNSASVGNLVRTDTAGTHLGSFDLGPPGRITYITHNTPRAGSPSAGFTFRWTAPSSGSSNAVLVVGANSANGDGQNTNDYISKQTFTAQRGASCSYAVNPTDQSFSAAGGAGRVTVTTTSGCAWTATTSDSFITISSGSSGSDSGTVSYSVAANTSTSIRTGTLTVAGQTVTITQAGASCNYAVAPISQSFSAEGGDGSVAVTTTAGCAWTATTSDSFITINLGASGSGSGTVSYSVAANTSTSSRTGTLTVAGQTVTITQAGVPCNFTVAPAVESIATTGGTGTITVTTTTGCAWTATSGAGFITISSGSSGSGSGTVNYSVAANTAAGSRIGTLTVAGKTVTITQTGTQPEAEKAYFAQFGNGDLGGGARLTSTLIIINRSATQNASGLVRFFDSNGAPIFVNINGSLAGDIFSVDIPPQGIRFYSTDGAGAVLVGSAQLSTTIPVSSVIVFSSTAGTTGVGAVQPIAKFLVPIEANRSLGVNTGVAISNPTGSSVDVAITLLDADGKPVAGGTTLQSLPPNGQLARFASELFGSVDFSQFRGTILVNSPVPINGMAIRVSPGQFSTLPVAPVN